MTSSFAHAVLESVLSAGTFNPADEIAPIAILWPDPAGEWKPVVSRLRRSGAEILTLGNYSPADAQGPALWIRSRLAELTTGQEPLIVYLPGIDRPSMRALESCPPTLRSIAELQFRSEWWIGADGTEWTPSSYLRAGVGVRVGADDATREALSIALGALTTVPMETLVARRYIDAEYLNALLLPDSVKALLNWMDSDGEAESGRHWKAFVSTCKSDFGIDPAKDGVLTAIARLGEREGKWAQVWTRFTEAPAAYPGILVRLRQARDSVLVVNHPGSWPQDNAKSETALSAALATAASLGTPAEVRTAVREMESEHGSRRSTIWGQLGQAPLAAATRHLAELADQTEIAASAASVTDLREWYTSAGSLVDDAVLSAISAVPEGPHRVAVSGIIRAIYRDWADDGARQLQDLLAKEGTVADTGLDLGTGECALFVDGLRYDVGRRLTAVLEAKGTDVELRSRLAPFPSMTSSGKPAVTPLGSKPKGGAGFIPVLDGKQMDAANLRAAMSRNGVTPFGKTENGDPSGKGWTEASDLDAIGHKVDLKIVDSLNGEVAEIASRVHALLDHGWSRVHVVTDHGWLLMPGGLPVVKIDVAKTVTKKSRCAQLAEHAGGIDQPEFPWTWDPAVRVATPRGIAAFEAGKVYDHGGVSPQETITPYLIVGMESPAAPVRIDGAAWKGLRCRISGNGSAADLRADMRTNPADASSSIATPKPWAPDGTALLVENDGQIGSVAFIVIVDSNGALVAQAPTIIGG